MITWNDKIEQWRNHIVQKYPDNIKKSFFFETSMCNKNKTTEYKEYFIETTEFDDIEEQDFRSFKKYIKMSDNKYATSFYNLSKDTLLIIPIPRKNKKYTTIKDFIDNASENQQKYYWNYVSHEIDKFLETNDQVYVSTHGLGVYYFHLRLCTFPKYYITEL